MEQNGIHVMPYINGRIWDTKDRRDQDYQFSGKAMQGAVKKESGELSLETYASHEPDGSLVKLATMCPSSYVWKKTIEDIVKKLFSKCNVSAIYIDQVAAAWSNLTMYNFAAVNTFRRGKMEAKLVEINGVQKISINGDNIELYTNEEYLIDNGCVNLEFKPDEMKLFVMIPNK